VPLFFSPKRGPIMPLEQPTNRLYMKAYHDFRLFYNQSIHPELMHLEARRKQIVRTVFISLGVATFLLLFAWYLNELMVTWLIIIGLGWWVSNIVTQIRLYYQSFKPRVVSLILDFIDNGINYSNLSFSPTGQLNRQTFLSSGLYICEAEDFDAEDFITGKIREMPFELCELRVADISPVRSGMETIFEGIFIVADFLKPDMRGTVYIMPDQFRKYHAQSTRAADRRQAHRVDNLLLPEFEAIFDTFASPEIKVDQVISDDFQRTLIHFYRKTNRLISISIVHSKIYIALHISDDLLEPKLWQSNISYTQIKAYYDDIDRVFSMIHAMDVLN
jgi:hypothetical protein